MDSCIGFKYLWNAEEKRWEIAFTVGDKYTATHLEDNTPTAAVFLLIEQLLEAIQDG